MYRAYIVVAARWETDEDGNTDLIETEVYEVDPATVGQYTGLPDKNGVKVFVGDIISYNGSREVVKFDTSLRIPCFTTGIGRGSSTAPHPYKISARHVVIGNVHDNPELLGGAE